MYFDLNAPLASQPHPDAPDLTRGIIDTDSSEKVDMTAYLDEGRTCTHCGQELAEYTGGWVHEDTNSAYCNEDDDPDGWGSPEDVADRLASEGYEGTTAEALADWAHDHNQATPAPTAPANWVGFTIDPANEMVEVQISVNDPRGCFSFSVRRWHDETTGRERLLLDVPTPGGHQHNMEVTPLWEGTYELR